MDPAVLTVLILVAICLALLWLLLDRRFIRRVYLTSKIPGPSLWEFYTVLLFELAEEKLHQMLDKQRETYGKLSGFWILHHFGVGIYDSESVKDLFKNGAFDDKPTPFYGDLAVFMGNNIVTINGGAKHKTNRKILGKPFRTQKIASHLERINIEALRLVDRLRDVATGEEADVRCIANDCVGAVFVHVVSSGTLPYKKIDQMLQLVPSISREVYLRCSNPLHYWFVHKLKASTWAFNSSVREMMANGKKVFLEEVNAASQRLIKRYEEDADSVLEAIAMHPDHSFEDGGFSEVKGILTAGNETTCTALNIALLLIALHPEVQEKVFQEIESILGEGGKFAGPRELSAMVYLEMTIKEVLRLFPPVPYIMRKNYKEGNISDTIIPEGSTVIVGIYALHRNPTVFEDPLKFDPERFSPERSKGRHPFAYIPFSFGARNCPGKSLAMMLLKTCLCHVIRNYKISPGRQYRTIEDIQIKTYVTMELCESSLCFTRRL